MAESYVPDFWAPRKNKIALVMRLGHGPVIGADFRATRLTSHAQFSVLGAQCSVQFMVN